MECYSCEFISSMFFTINDRIDIPKSASISICCLNNLGDIPSIPLKNDPQENLERFLGMRHLQIIRGLSPDAKEQNFVCAKCHHYVKREWAFSSYILYVNFSIYPSPCQCRCIYCDVYKKKYTAVKYFKKNPAVSVAYENVFNTLKLAKKIGIIIPQKTRWQVSSGEISIHPYKKEFFNFVRGEYVTFYTNTFIFDEDIALELHDNPAASINLSIDSGTPETWYKVKGVNNFQHVLDNLRAYRKATQHPAQITLKYIICPGINDSEEDFNSFVEIVKSLGIQQIIATRDVNKKSEPPVINGFFSDIINSSARLLAICNFNGIDINYFHEYTEEELYCVSFLANKLIENMR